MKKIIVAVYDVVAAVYAYEPQFALTRGAAERAFRDAANNPESDIGKHPADYELHEVGSFDDESGTVLGLEGRPIVYGRGNVFVHNGGAQ